MIQAMQILQLPTLDLTERIEQELTENPFLETAEPEADSPEEQPEGWTEPAAGDSQPDQDGVESMLDLLERYEKDFGDGRSLRAAPSEEGDRKYEAMQNAPSAPCSLAEALVEELAFLRLDAEAEPFGLSSPSVCAASSEALARTLRRTLRAALADVPLDP